MSATVRKKSNCQTGKEDGLYKTSTQQHPVNVNRADESAAINYTFNLVSLEMLQKYQCPDFGGGIFLYIHIMLYILRANSIYISI